MAVALLTFFFLRETRGLSLEEIVHKDFNAIVDHKVVDEERERM